MKKFKIELHTKIIAGLILGAIFGAIFSVNKFSLNFTNFDNKNQTHTTTETWEKLIFINNLNSDSVTFGKNDQQRILNFFNKNKESNKYDVLIINQSQKRISNVIEIAKEKTIGTVIKPIGDLFIRLLSFIAIPLVLASLIVGAGSLDDVKKLGRIGIKTFTLFMATTVCAISIGVVLTNIIQPGNKISQSSKEMLINEYSEETAKKIQSKSEIDLIDFFVTIVPKNPFEAISKAEMLQIVFFAVFLGITLTFLKKEHSEPILNFFNGLSEAMIKMVKFIMKFAPFGVFALISVTIANFGFEIFSTLIWYMLTVLLGLTLQLFIVYGSIVKFLARRNFFEFLKGMKTAMAIAFSTSSSAATLPVTMDCVENNLKVPKKIAGFVLPLGATINMDGTALYQGVATIFIAQIYGIDIGIIGQISVIITAVLASIGTAPVPGVGIIMLVMILQSVHIPPEGIALILGVDRLLDMARTIPNIIGDSTIALTVASYEK